MIDLRILALVACILLLLAGNLYQSHRLRRLDERSRQHAATLAERLAELESFRERFDPLALEHRDEEFLAVLRSLATYADSMRRGEPAAVAAGAAARGAG